MLIILVSGTDKNLWFFYYSITTPLLLIAMVASFFGYRKLTSGPNTWKVCFWASLVYLSKFNFLFNQCKMFFSPG